MAVGDGCAPNGNDGGCLQRHGDPDWLSGGMLGVDDATAARSRFSESGSRHGLYTKRSCVREVAQSANPWLVSS